MSRRSTCPSGQSFFGLTPKDQDIFLEPTFLLMYYGNFSFMEAFNIPLSWRRWFVGRINKEMAKQQESGDDGSETSPGTMTLPASAIMNRGGGGGRKF